MAYELINTHPNGMILLDTETKSAIPLDNLNRDYDEYARQVKEKKITDVLPDGKMEEVEQMSRKRK